MDLLLYVVALVVLSVVFWWSLRSLHRAGLPSTIDGMRVEATAAVVAEDRVLEVLWEVPVIVSNTSRRPRQVPLISDQAHVWAGRAKYLCGVSSETDWQADDGRVLVLNPGARGPGRPRGFSRGCDGKSRVPRAQSMNRESERAHTPGRAESTHGTQTRKEEQRPEKRKTMNARRHC